MQTVATDKIDILLASEPNKILVEKSRWYLDSNLDAAIGILRSGIEIIGSGKGQGFVWVECMGLILVSCYVSPNITIDSYETFFYELDCVIGSCWERCLIAGDFNAK